VPAGAGAGVARVSAPGPVAAEARGDAAASAALTTAAATATTANGTNVESPWASSPPSAGPIIVPADAATTAGPTRSAPPSDAASHAAPAVHSIPKATPNPARPAISTPSPSPACAAQPSASSAPAASVTRRAPQRSASRPTGTETASIASPGSASTSAATGSDRPSWAEIRGSSATITVWPRPETKNSAHTSAVTGPAPVLRESRDERRVDAVRTGESIDRRRYDLFSQLFYDLYRSL
jgi:hypothetical protein